MLKFAIINILIPQLVKLAVSEYWSVKKQNASLAEEIEKLKAEAKAAEEEAEEEVLDFDEPDPEMDPDFASDLEGLL